MPFFNPPTSFKKEKKSKKTEYRIRKYIPTYIPFKDRTAKIPAKPFSPTAAHLRCFIFNSFLKRKDLLFQYENNYDRPNALLMAPRPIYPFLSRRIYKSVQGHSVIKRVNGLKVEAYNGALWEVLQKWQTFYPHTEYGLGDRWIARSSVTRQTSQHNSVSPRPPQPYSLRWSMNLPSARILAGHSILSLYVYVWLAQPISGDSIK